MESERFKVLAALEAVAIVILAVILVITWSPTIASSQLSTSSDDSFLDDGRLLSNGTYMVVKELRALNMAGSVNFTVDDGWNAISINVQGIGGSDVSWTVTPPGYPSGATIVNGTAMPFMASGPFHVEGGSVAGQLSPLYNKTMGDWTLHYDVHGGMAKIYIVLVELADL